MSDTMKDQPGAVSALPAPKVPAGRPVVLLLLLFGGLFALVVSLRLGLWFAGSPGAGLFPFIAAVGVVAFSAMALVQAIASGIRLPAWPGRRARPGLSKVGIYIAGMAFYALFLKPLGFAVVTAVVVASILRFAERYRWRSVLIVTVATIVISHVVFNMLLGARLPAGTVWRQWLP